MRSMAGFSPSIQANFYLPRAKTLPPQSLEQAVWPLVDEWLAWFDSHANSNDGGGGGGDEDGEVKKGSPVRAGESEDEADGRDLAAQGFLRLLQQLRIILLQDSVIMRQEFPDHPIWTDPVFEQDDYRVFAKDVELFLLDVEELEEVQIRKTLPAIAERLNILHQSLARDVKDLSVQTREELNDIKTRLRDLFEGRVSITLSATRDVAAPACATPASMTTVTSFHPVPASPPAAVPGDAEPLSPAAAASYVLSRTISTVPQLWREWTVGLGNGPSVQGLEDLYGPRWRRARSETVIYSQRKVIIEIWRQQATGINTGAALEEVELMRQRDRLSLRQLFRLLNRQRKSV